MQDNKIITITMALLLGIFLQVVLLFADMQDSPDKAAIEFAKAYFRHDKAMMSDRLCKDGNADMLDKYVTHAEKEAEERGFSVCYLGNKLYDPETYTLSSDHTKASVRLTGGIRPPLRSFFTKQDIVATDQTFDLVKEGDKWKVCGENLFAMSE